MLNNDPLANILYIDLSKRIFKIEKDAISLRNT